MAGLRAAAIGVFQVRLPLNLISARLAPATPSQPRRNSIFAAAATSCQTVLLQSPVCLATIVCVPCYKRQADLLQMAGGAATSGRRCRYSRPSRLLQAVGGAATIGRRGCYGWPAALLESAVEAATSGRRRCYKLSVALLQKYVGAATEGRHGCYTRPSSLLQTTPALLQVVFSDSVLPGGVYSVASTPAASSPAASTPVAHGGGAAMGHGSGDMPMACHR